MLPRLQKVSELCNKLGVYHIFKSDGNLWPVAGDLFVKSGIHGYIEIEGDAGMDLGRLKKIWASYFMGKFEHPSFESGDS